MKRDGPILMRELVTDVTLTRWAVAVSPKPRTCRPVIIRHRAYVKH